ncbi:unnamed protein product [Bursaphelenchus okinawaensis]|uniref:CHK kinase-like domain-containing protein n=1 Tax=Bursaphelenchus okinawaensis TaxID=465554 RepID=A0A811KXT5_9BILA|nr:unnamed protein product [Bursaphelenchus okinawaensis]CAG9112786.1 unnamed protein product [Bursaphelenchus okinawaensis]
MSKTVLQLTDQIKPTLITVQELLEDINQQSNWLENGTVRKVESSSIYMGFNSSVVRLFLTLDNNNMVNIILKQPTSQFDTDSYNPLEKSFTKNICLFHNQEILFYRTFSLHFSCIRFPNMYASRQSNVTTAQHGYIALEDLGPFGSTKCTLRGLDYSQCVSTIQTMAKYHAYSHVIGCDNKLFDSMETAIPSLDLIPFNLYDHAVKFEPKLEAYKDQINLFLQTRDMPVDVHKQFDYPAVLVHGDLWADNILFKDDNVLCFLDWQCSHVGTGLEDLAKFLFMSAYSDVLKSQIPDLLKVYYEAFKASMTEYNRTFEVTFEKVTKIFKHQSSFEYLFCMLVLPPYAQKATSEAGKQELRNRLVHVIEYLTESNFSCGLF